MQTEMIIISEYCRNSDIEPSFISLLEDNGLITTIRMDDELYIRLSDLPELEKYARWYYDLSINIEGIDTIRHLLERVSRLQQEIRELKSRIQLFNTHNF